MAGSATVALALAGVIVTAPLHADLTIRIKETSGANTTVRVEYYKQHLWRTDWSGGAYTIATLTVFDGPTRPAVPRVAIKGNGRRPQGLPVWEKVGDQLLEVTELSEAPLDPQLFEPPPGFRRIIRPIPGEPLSWSDRLLLYWQQVLDWIGSLGQ